MHKYITAEVHLKNYNTEENIKFYRDKGVIAKWLTYIWDGCGLLNNIIKGWIPRDLIKKFKTYQIKKNCKNIKEIIIEWMNKCHLYFKTVWKTRCNILIDWKVTHNIINIKKRKGNGNKKSINKNCKQKILGKRMTYYHTVNETFYKRVKKKIGMNLFQ